MINTLPSRNLSLLKTLLGKKITLVKRQLFKDDMDLADFEQNADGPVEFIVDGHSTIHFVAETEKFSIGIVSGEMLCYGDSYVLTDVSNNSFWADRIGQKITRLSLFKASDWSKDYPSEFGIEISFNNGKKVLIEYVDDEEHPDMIKVASNYTGQPCIINLIEKDDCLKGFKV